MFTSVTLMWILFFRQEDTHVDWNEHRDKNSYIKCNIFEKNDNYHWKKPARYMQWQKCCATFESNIELRKPILQIMKFQPFNATEQIW